MQIIAIESFVIKTSVLNSRRSTELPLMTTGKNKKFTILLDN